MYIYIFRVRVWVHFTDLVLFNRSLPGFVVGLVFFSKEESLQGMEKVPHAHPSKTKGEFDSWNASFHISPPLVFMNGWYQTSVVFFLEAALRAARQAALSAARQGG